MQIDLNNLEEKDVQESCERMMSNGPFINDMSDNYADELHEVHQKGISQQEKTIFGIPISEIRRQCQAYHPASLFDQPLNPSQDPMDVVIEGGKKILNEPETLKLVRSIYRKNDK